MSRILVKKAVSDIARADFLIDISKKAKVCPVSTDNINKNKFDINEIEFDRHRILS